MLYFLHDAEARPCLCRDLPTLYTPTKVPGRHSISSTAATVADDDAASLEQDAWSSRAPSNASALTGAGGSPVAGPHSRNAGLGEEKNAAEGAGDVEAASASLGGSGARNASMQSSAQPEITPESEASAATLNGSNHGAATSNDVDPFAETDAAFHSNADLEVVLNASLLSFGTPWYLLCAFSQEAQLCSMHLTRIISNDYVC